ncbi:MAG: NifB/NifX family molybdenum-iron cluster-binding protein [Lachnospiraceae bacterium]
MMVIAVPYENKQVFQHFGKTETFKIYEVSDGRMIAEEILSADGHGHGELVDILKNRKVSVLICGGIGSGAQNLLSENGIQFFGGVMGAADKAVEDYLLKQLNYNPDVKCDHHEDAHTCEGHENGCEHH